MEKKWWVLFSLLTAVCFWFVLTAGYHLSQYGRLDRHAAAHVTSWEIEERSQSKLFIVARYNFTVEGATYEGKTRFEKPEFLNRPSAENALNSFSSYSWSVWYSAKKPNHSTLQRLFPYKSCFNATVTLAVLIYFCFLYWQTVSRKNRKIV